jgi:hypothetical protein
VEMSIKRKPHGYWENFDNLQAELLVFLQENGLSAFPTRDVFVKCHRADLSNAIGHHGGSYPVAQKMGLILAHNKKPQKYWNDFENLKRELLEALEENGWEAIPIQSKLVAAGRADICIAMTKHGGIYKVSERVGVRLETDEKPNGYWTLEVTIRELEEFLKVHPFENFPTKRELVSYNRFDLINAIKHNGGVHKIAQMVNRKPTGKPANYWSEENLINGITAFMEENGMDTVPLIPDLKDARRHDIVSAIRKFGGIYNVAELMGKKVTSKSKHTGYWTIENLRLEIENLLTKYHLQKIPTYAELAEMDRWDLTGAITKFGGIYKVGDMLGLEVRATGKPNGYWTLENTKNELFAFMKSNNLTDMPSGLRIRDAGRIDLLGAIQKHGGFYELSNLFSLKIPIKLKRASIRKKRESYWTLETIKKEITEYMEVNGMDYFPTTTLLYEQHRSDLVGAIGKFGGVHRVADSINIPTNTSKPSGYWNLSTIEKELFELMKQNSFTKMPTKNFFEESERYDLLNAMASHGGMNQIALLFGMGMENPQRPTGYWTLENLEIELVQFLEQNNLDAMPSMEFIKSAGRGDLEGAIAKFGGIWKVCQSLGINMTFDPELAFHHETSYAEDGHFCFSRNEKVIDEWLYSHGIQHEKEVRYPYHEKYNKFNYVCDWLCGDIYLEFAGMMNIARYARSIQNKLALAEELGLNLVILSLEDVGEFDKKLCGLFHLETNNPSQLHLFDEEML